MQINFIIRLFVLILCIIPLKHNAFAGPPFLTDDPVPVEYKHWEFYLFSTMDKTNAENNLQLPAIEINIGAIPNVQLHFVIPHMIHIPNDGARTNGLGDIETGIKYRFIEETEHRPQIAIFPLFELPTGNENRNLGNGRLWVKLPIWLQKSWGDWTTYGGGGYAINSAPLMKNFLYAGWLLQREFNQKVTLGAEVFTQGADSVDSSAFTILNAGGYYNFNKNVSFLFTAGHSLIGERHSIAYLGLYWTG
jgi:hypothetical protein